MKMICKAKKDGKCDRDIGPHCTEHENDIFCSHRCRLVSTASCVPVEGKTCHTCWFSWENNETGKPCQGKGCVNYSRWQPVPERTCKTCAKDNGGICALSRYGGTCTDYSKWQPKPTNNCTDCAHEFEAKFEPVDIGFCINTEEELQIVKTFVNEWTNADGSICWAVPRILHDQLKARGIE